MSNATDRLSKMRTDECPVDTTTQCRVIGSLAKRQVSVEGRGKSLTGVFSRKNGKGLKTVKF